MTVCGQELHYMELTTLNEMLESGTIRDQDLARIVQNAIAQEGSAQLIGKIAQETRNLIYGGAGEKVITGFFNESVSRQIGEVVDRTIADVLEKRSGELQTAIEEAVKRAVDAKLNALKIKVSERKTPKGK